MSQFLALARRTRAWPYWWRYLGASSITLVALIADLLLPWGRASRDLLLFIPAVVLGVLLFGQRGGIWSVMFGGGLAAYFLFEPQGFAIADPADAFALVLFICVALFIVFAVGEALRELEAKAAELAETAKARDTAVDSDRAKDLLLQEQAHRTKNDLQVISAMLQIEGRTLDDSRGKACLLSAAGRINVMSRVHSLLQSGSRRGLVDLEPFIRDLCSDLQISLVGVRPIALRAEVESALFPLERAAPLALIVNELVTNAVKHGFSDERPGLVKVRLSKKGEEEFELLIEDDGVGFPHDAAALRASGFGHKMVRSLGQQLGGVFTIDSEQDGVRCKLRFPARQR